MVMSESQESTAPFPWEGTVWWTHIATQFALSAFWFLLQTFHYLCLFIAPRWAWGAIKRTVWPLKLCRMAGYLLWVTYWKAAEVSCNLWIRQKQHEKAAREKKEASALVATATAAGDNKNNKNNKNKEDNKNNKNKEDNASSDSSRYVEENGSSEDCFEDVEEECILDPASSRLTSPTDTNNSGSGGGSKGKGHSHHHGGKQHHRFAVDHGHHHGVVTKQKHHQHQQVVCDVTGGHNHHHFNHNHHQGKPKSHHHNLSHNNIKKEDPNARYLVSTHASRSQLPEDTIFVHTHTPRTAQNLFGIQFKNTYNKHFGVFERPYTSPIFNGHMSTIIANFRPVVDVDYDLEIVTGCDGCDIYLDWAYADSAKDGNADKGIIAVIPGLASSSRSNYIQTFVRHAVFQCGFHVCVVNTRGMGAAPLSKPQLMSGAFTDDVRHFFNTCLSKQRLRERFGTRQGRDVPLIAVGFSLGGNVLSKYLGEEGKAGRPTPIACAASVCSPWDFHQCRVTMDKKVSHLLYHPALVGGLNRYLMRHEKTLATLEELQFHALAANPPKTVSEFDERVIVPHFGYKNVEEYYSDAMCFPLMQHAKVPMLCVTATDDPVVGAPLRSERWINACKANANLVHLQLPAGGHLGFLQDPVREVLRLPNCMEVLVCDALLHRVERMAHE